MPDSKSSTVAPQVTEPVDGTRAPATSATPESADAPPGVTTGTDTPALPGSLIADLLVKAGHLTPDQVEYALRVWSKLPSPQPIVSILKQLEFISEEQIYATLQGSRVDIQLGTLLLEMGIVSDVELRTALAIKADQPDKRLGEILRENHVLAEDELLSVLSLQLGFRYLEAEKLQCDRIAVGKARKQWFEKHGCVPVRDEDGSLMLAMLDPTESQLVKDAERIFGEPVVPCAARSYVIETAIRQLSRNSADAETFTEDNNTIVKAVEDILERAIEDGASDIHIEPMKDRIRVRFRLDGVLFSYKELPMEMARPLSSRIKILAGADIAERRRHQDGRLLYETDGLKIDIRVSFYATVHGEKIVLRLLNNRSKLLDINELGMAPRMFDRFVEDVLEVPSGVVLVTGPTGSGKTTTLYGAINYLNDINTSIVTAEDPVEYVIPGISQCSINPKINLTYEETLRHIVRQDPDVIVIGEIRDRFSADTAIQAALTGHKVLTTFHTEDSIGGLLRLLHMDIEAFLISSTVVCVVAQRLVRRVCPQCSEEHVLAPEEIRRLGYNPADVRRLVFARGRGCSACRFLGYRGRVSVFEMLILDEQVRDALIGRRTSHEIRRICTESTGLVSLLEDGIVKASQGQTSYEEIIRALPRLAKPRPLQQLHRMQGVTQ